MVKFYVPRQVVKLSFPLFLQTHLPPQSNASSRILVLRHPDLPVAKPSEVLLIKGLCTAFRCDRDGKEQAVIH